MKKILFIATTVSLLFASCSNDEVIGTGTNDGNTSEIGFRTLIDKDTRASVTTTDNITSFTVTGWWDKTGTQDYGNTTTGTYLFNGYNLARGEDKSKEWDYDPKNYWPAENKGKVDFFAYSPASTLNIIDKKGIEGYTGAAIEYTVPQISEDGVQQEDFLVTKALGLEEKTNSGKVALNFRHALSRVKFLAKKDNPDITYVIKEVSLVNLYPSAKLDYANIPNENANPAEAVDYTGGVTTLWEDHSGTKVSYTADMGDSPIMLPYDANNKDKYYSILGDINAIMVMPQKTDTLIGTVPDDTKKEFAIAVSYKAYIDDYYYAGNPIVGDADEWKTKYIRVKALHAAPIDDEGITFQFGKQYNFYLKLGDEVGDAVDFSVNVVDWSDNADNTLPEVTNYVDLVSGFLKTGVTITPTLPDGSASNPITKAHLLSVTKIEVKSSANIMDFTGIEYFENLETLSLDGVTNKVDLDASKNSKLKVAGFYGSSELGTVNLSNTALTTIKFGSPTFENLNLSNTKLTQYGTIAGQIKLGAVTVTGTLDLSNCGLTTIDEMPTAITTLDLSNNKFTTLDFSSSTSITNLNLSNNGLTSVKLPPHNLGNVNLSKNNFTTLTIGGTTDITIANLDISNNNILTTLQTIKLAVTGKINAQGNTALTNIKIGDGDIKLGGKRTTIAALDIRNSVNLKEILVRDGGTTTGDYGYTISVLTLWQSCTKEIAKAKTSCGNGNGYGQILRVEDAGGTYLGYRSGGNWYNATTP
ncbi:fimbrillin family protein [Bacteroides sp. 519]|uniref:fimbrillin family protein n=1 Tax=Bacteroides sp. 519 TaxID=2302937 RepID=UPI0013D61DB2|nr:fimbrillin family protein [Bacteroides sp. 519]NDV59144.1 hypothetical protein [Bacteroides sp. 519]